MIKSFKNSDTEKVFQRTSVRQLSPELQRAAKKRLNALDAATNINDLRTPPSNHLEVLKGDRIGQHSIRINRQYRICFRWEGDNAYEVEITDYH